MMRKPVRWAEEEVEVRKALLMQLRCRSFLEVSFTSKGLHSERSIVYHMSLYVTKKKLQSSVNWGRPRLPQPRSWPLGQT